MTEPMLDRSLVIRNVALLVAFVALLVIGVITVLIPELSDDEAAPGVDAGVAAADAGSP